MKIVYLIHEAGCFYKNLSDIVASYFSHNLFLFLVKMCVLIFTEMLEYACGIICGSYCQI